MSEVVKRPDVGQVLARLKDFQRDTVEYVFRRMYLDADATRRFLVADEVGLGKTLVARGVIAKVVDHLWGDVERIDIVYICSNAAIARQNLHRLSVPGAKQCTLPSRITLLPTTVRNLQQQRLNFIALTPGTSFELKSSLGLAEERALLYWLLPEAWREENNGALHLLQGDAGTARFKETVRSFPDRNHVDDALTVAFRRHLDDHIVIEQQNGTGAHLRSRFQDLCVRFRVARQSLPDEDRQARSELVGELRTRLATTCLRALEPDLIILDEFQRFKHLLDGRDEASQLARDLFTFQGARVLLLSATPYKMYTLQDEAEADDHFADFIQTIRFLQGNAEQTEGFRNLLGEYRRELIRVGGGPRSTLLARKEAVEASLRSVMVRTERLAVTADRNGMLAETTPPGVALHAKDVAAYLELQRLAKVLEHPDAVEYWKSAPYLVNFMDDYQIKRTLTAQLAQRRSDPETYDALSRASGSLLSWEDIESYRQIDPGNARLRSLMADMIETGVWQVLWVPPALPYYKLSGPYASPAAAALTKRLVFSSWQVVPKVVATLVSYEAERRIFQKLEGDSAKNTVEARKGRAPLLRFARTEGRLTGMPVLALLYPSVTLARIGDPLVVRADISAQNDGVSLGDVLERVREHLDRVLNELHVEEVEGGQVDEAWYWAAPILLDLHLYPDATARWFGQKDLAAVWRGTLVQAGIGQPVGVDVGEEGDVEIGWALHLDEALALLRRKPRFGRRPPDLAMVLAKMAVAGPGIVALRALSRLAGGAEGTASVAIRNAAGRVAWALRSLFNLPEVSALIRGLDAEEPYWERILEYSANGCLQAVLDEYVHILVDSLGLNGRQDVRAVQELAGAMCNAVQLRAANLGVDVVRLDGATKRATLEPRTLRTRFAARFGGRQADGSGPGDRQDDVRAAFNSPFWPFVLCTTSVGQEGLDFHHYCHAVVHWNLPSNPVDLEQREGRVHRYKGHAVRKNVAALHGGAAFKLNGADPWARIFAAARAHTERGDSDLIPYWLYPVEGGARIERHIPMLPLSKDCEHAQALRRSLAVYRMAFGQSRQEDLMAYLLKNMSSDELIRLNDDLRINLSPPRIAATLYPDAVEVQTAAGGPVGEENRASDWEQEFESSAPKPIVTLEALENFLDSFMKLKGLPEGDLFRSRLEELLNDYAVAKGGVTKR